MENRSGVKDQLLHSTARWKWEKLSYVASIVLYFFCTILYYAI